MAQDLRWRQKGQAHHQAYKSKSKDASTLYEVKGEPASSLKRSFLPPWFLRSTALLIVLALPGIWVFYRHQPMVEKIFHAILGSAEQPKTSALLDAASDVPEPELESEPKPEPKPEPKAALTTEVSQTQDAKSSELSAASLGIDDNDEPKSTLPSLSVLSASQVDPNDAMELPIPSQDVLTTSEPSPLRALRMRYRRKIHVLRNESAAISLRRAGIVRRDIAQVLAALAPLFPFRRMRPGDSLDLDLDGEGVLWSLEVSRGMEARARAWRTEIAPAAALSQTEAWQAKKVEIPIRVEMVSIEGKVVTSLWDSVVAIGEDPRLVHEIVDIFAWEIDFYSQVYPGDSYRVLVEKRHTEGRFMGYGSIFAAEFIGDGEVHQGFLYRPDKNSQAGESYYDLEGRSLRKQLLKSPLKYGHITSRFGRRKHPVLGYTRAHNGVDYGVPTGTPVWSVGDGRVVRANFHGGFGRLVEVRHSNGWLSQYAHLSKIMVRVGQKVRQKQHVGLVGQTGLASGPHLHYGLKHHGKYTNPLSQRFARAKPLTGSVLEAFRRNAHRNLELLGGLKMAQEGTLKPKGG